MTIYRSVILASLVGADEIEASGGKLFPYGKVRGYGINSISFSVKDMVSVFAFGSGSGAGACGHYFNNNNVDGRSFDTKALVANNTGEKGKAGEAISFSFTPSYALNAGIDDTYGGVKVMADNKFLSLAASGGGFDRGDGATVAAAAGLGGGGGGGGSEDVGWGYGLAKVLEREVGLDAAGFDIQLATHGGGGVSEGKGKGHDKKFLHEFAAAGLEGEGLGGGGLLGGLAGWSNWSYVGGGGNSDVNVKWSGGVGLDSSAFHGGMELGGVVCSGKEEGAKDNLVNGLGSGGGNSGVLTGLVGNPTKARFGGDDNLSAGENDSDGDLGVVAASSQKYLGGGGYSRGSAEKADEGGVIKNAEGSGEGEEGGLYVRIHSSLLAWFGGGEGGEYGLEVDGVGVSDVNTNDGEDVISEDASGGGEEVGRMVGWIVDVSSEGWDITSGEHEDLADGGGLGGLSDKVAAKEEPNLLVSSDDDETGGEVAKVDPLLSSILFQDLGEKAGSVESITQHKGFIYMPDDLNDYLLEEEEVFGGVLEEDASEDSMEEDESSADIVVGYALEEEDSSLEFPVSNSWSFLLSVPNMANGVEYQIVNNEEEDGGGAVVSNGVEKKEVVPMKWSYHHSIFQLIGVLIVVGAVLAACSFFAPSFLVMVIAASYFMKGKSRAKVARVDSSPRHRYKKQSLRLLMVVLCLLAKCPFVAGQEDIDLSYVREAPVKNKNQVQDMSDLIFKELLLFHQKPTSAFHLGHVARRVHNIIHQASGTSQHFVEEFKQGSAKLLNHIEMEHSRNLIDMSEADRARHLSLGANSIGIAAFVGIVAFLSFLLVPNLVDPPDDGKFWSFVTINDNEFLTGAPGRSFRNIFPCSQAPFDSDKLFGYLPITQGLTGNVIGRIGESDAAEVILPILLDFLSDGQQLGNDEANIPNPENCAQEEEGCYLTSECCKESGFIVNCNSDLSSIGQCERVEDDAPAVAGGFAAFEPFCLAWSKACSEDDECSGIDTLAFIPPVPWPPVEPLPGLFSLLPSCSIDINSIGIPTKAGPCKYCIFAQGIPLTDFYIQSTRFKVTLQLTGFAVSWAETGKLAYGSNSFTRGEAGPLVWDGFQQRPLPEVPNFNLWLSVRFNIYEYTQWDLSVKECEGTFFTPNKLTLTPSPDLLLFDRGVTNNPKPSLLSLRLVIDAELYVRFAAQNSDGNDSDPEEVAEKLSNVILGEGDEGEDQCIILAVPRVGIKLPLLSGYIVFANAIGGLCTIPPEDNGTRCFPSGFFLNIQNEFDIQGGLEGLIDSVLNFIPDNDVVPPLESAGNSIGIFQDSDGNTEAVVLRLEFPVTSLFGVSTGIPRPIIHLQYVKGSEIERRRSTLLRKKYTDGGPYVANCPQVDQDCNQWDPFDDGTGDDVEICSDILLNEEDDPDKLLYYNRILTAEPTDRKQKYKIIPPKDTEYQIPAKYNFRNKPDADVTIVYLALEDFRGCLIPSSCNSASDYAILFKTISVTLIFGNRQPSSIDIDLVKDDFNNATETYTDRYNNIFTPLQKDLFREPDLFNFELEGYLNYLPETNWTELSEEEVVTRIESADEYNVITDGAKADRLDAFVRIFCKVTVLWFLDISLGFIMENYADGVTPTEWAVAGQFQVDLIGLRFSVAIDTTIGFDRRRHLHLKGDEYHRALSSESLETALWNVALFSECIPDTACEAIVEFFDDVGAGFWNGFEFIVTFFTEDIVEFYNIAVGALGEWGENFLEAIDEFGIAVRDDWVDSFENGETSQLLNDERTVAFTQDSKDLYEDLSGGEIKFDDALVAGTQILRDGFFLGVEFLLAGITDVFNALVGFFENVVEFLADIFKTGNIEWVEVRQRSYYTSINDCKSNCEGATGDDIKRKCWCMDELQCPVLIAEKRQGNQICGLGFCGKISYTSWAAVEIEISGPTFPRFDSRGFEEACRTERLQGLAQAEEAHSDMVASSQTLDDNLQQNFKGLENFSSASRMRRQLSVVTSVENLMIPEFDVVDRDTGMFVSQFSAQYSGAQLKPDSLDDVNILDGEQFSRDLDFSQFGNPSNNGPADGSSIILKEAQLGATDKYFGALNFEDTDFMGRQPIITPPVIRLVDGSQGTEDNPVDLDCSGAVQNAWIIKLKSSNANVMQARRIRHLESSSIAETAVDLAVKATLRKKILNGDDVLVEVEPGTVVGVDGDEDIFKEARDLIGTNGVGAFMDPQNFVRRLESQSLDDYKLTMKLFESTPLCDNYQWTFEIHVTDSSGKKSDPIYLYAKLDYGDSFPENLVQRNIETICDTDPIGLEDLEDNRFLRKIYGESSVLNKTFSPQLKENNCRSPYLSLDYSDSVTQTGVPCTTTYQITKRKWRYISSRQDCEVPPFAKVLSNTGLYDQTIIQGGKTIPQAYGYNDEPDTPRFSLKDATFSLPDTQQASVSPVISDFISVDPSSLCDLCPIESSLPQTFDCDDLGNSIVDVTVTNTIGISVTKSATVLIVDEKPPNLITKDHTVFLNKFGWLNDTDIVTVNDIDGGSWDNCGINEIYVTPTPIYQCDDEGPQTVTLFASDSSLNANSKEQIVIVDDNARLGINDDKEVVMPNVTDNLIDPKMRNDFNFKKCEEIAVYVRPEGNSNFDKYEGFSNGVNGKWKIPKFYNKSDDQSVLFYNAFCGGIFPEDLPEGSLCLGEVKAEVLCEDRSAKGPKYKKILHQTCYRARVRFDPNRTHTDELPDADVNTLMASKALTPYPWYVTEDDTSQATSRHAWLSSCWILISLWQLFL